METIRIPAPLTVPIDQNDSFLRGRLKYTLPCGIRNRITLPDRAFDWATFKNIYFVLITTACAGTYTQGAVACCLVAAFPPYGRHTVGKPHIHTGRGALQSLLRTSCSPPHPERQPGSCLCCRKRCFSARCRNKCMLQSSLHRKLVGFWPLLVIEGNKRDTPLFLKAP